MRKRKGKEEEGIWTFSSTSLISHEEKPSFMLSCKEQKYVLESKENNDRIWLVDDIFDDLYRSECACLLLIFQVT